MALVVKALEINYDDRIGLATFMEDIAHMFCGKISGSLTDSGVEVILGTKDAPALDANDVRTIARFIGDGDLVALTLIAAEREPNLQ